MSRLLRYSLQYSHNDHDGVSNHQPHGCLLNCLFRRRSRKTSKLHVTGLCAGNSLGPVNSPHSKMFYYCCFCLHILLYMYIYVYIYIIYIYIYLNTLYTDICIHYLYKPYSSVWNSALFYQVLLHSSVPYTWSSLVIFNTLDCSKCV